MQNSKAEATDPKPIFSEKMALVCVVNPLDQGFLEIKEPLNSQNLAVGEFIESEYVQDRAAIESKHRVVDDDARNVVWLKDIASDIIGAHDVKQRGLGLPIVWNIVVKRMALVLAKPKRKRIDENIGFAIVGEFGWKTDYDWQFVYILLRVGEDIGRAANYR